jgi:hypothetical protein
MIAKPIQTGGVPERSKGIAWKAMALKYRLKSSNLFSSAKKYSKTCTKGKCL